MRTFVVIVNIILVATLSVFIGVMSAIFFIGSDITYARLLQTLPPSFARRALGGICVGFIGAALILLINYLILKIKPATKVLSLKKLFWGTVMITIIASIVGTAIFFSN